MKDISKTLENIKENVKIINKPFEDLKDAIEEGKRLERTWALSDVILGILSKEDESTRELIFQTIRENFCVYCGSEQGGLCTCMMDD